MFVGGESWTPANIGAALKAWYDASDATTITATGSSVNQWRDKSTNAFHLAAGSGTEPTTGVTTKNGLNVIDFATTGSGDDVNAVASSAPADWKWLHDGSVRGVVSMVINVWPGNSNPNAAGAIFATYNLSSSNVGMTLYWDDRAAVPYNEVLRNLVSRGSGLSEPVDNASGSGGMPPNAWHLVSFILEADHGTANQRSIFHVDQGSAIQNNANTAAPSASNPVAELYVGRSTAGTFPISMSLAEIVFTSDYTTRADIETYLKAKWAV